MSFLSRNNQPSSPNLNSTRPEQNAGAVRVGLVNRASTLAGVASQHQAAAIGAGPTEPRLGDYSKDNIVNHSGSIVSHTPNGPSDHNPNSFRDSDLSQSPERDTNATSGDVVPGVFNSPENVARLVAVAQTAADSGLEKPVVQTRPPSHISEVEQLGGYLDRAA